MVRIKFKDGTVLDGDKLASIEMETMLGTLIAEPYLDDQYPGYYINLKRPNGNEFSPMLVEVDQEMYGEGAVPMMKMHYWSPEHHFDDPVWDERLTAEEIDSAWKEE